MDPLPYVNKAYSIVVRVLKQRNIQTNLFESLDNSVMVIKIAHGGLAVKIRKKISIRRIEYVIIVRESSTLRIVILKFTAIPNGINN